MVKKITLIWENNIIHIYSKCKQFPNLYFTGTAPSLDMNSTQYLSPPTQERREAIMKLGQIKEYDEFIKLGQTTKGPNDIMQLGQNNEYGNYMNSALGQGKENDGFSKGSGQYGDFMKSGENNANNFNAMGRGRIK